MKTSPTKSNPITNVSPDNKNSTAKRKSFAGFILMALLSVIAVTGCNEKSDKHSASKPELPLLHLACRFSPAIISQHDIYFVNTTGTALSEVKLTITVVGEDGSPKITRYWSSWSLGGEQQIQVPLSTVRNVQRIEVEGTADQGRFEEDFRP